MVEGTSLVEEKPRDNPSQSNFRNHNFTGRQFKRIIDYTNIPASLPVGTEIILQVLLQSEHRTNGHGNKF